MNIGLLLSTSPEPPPAGSLTLIRVSRRAMATTFEIAIPVGFPNAIAAAEDALDLIDELEQQLSVYRESSELTRVNNHAAEAPVGVELQLFELLQLCATLTNETARGFDPATGSLIRAWGFLKREGRVPAGSELAAARAMSGFRHVILDSNLHTVRFRKTGLEINLGGIGKGYALDRAAERLRTRWGVTSALLHGGGSSVLAIGRPPNDVRGWPIAIKHPTDPDRIIETVYLADRALGTSAATHQFFEYNGKKYGHLLDPRTGCPAEGTLSASCMAATAATADALSTAFFVRGAAWANEYCQSRPHLAAVILPHDELNHEKHGRRTTS